MTRQERITIEFVKERKQWLNDVLRPDIEFINLTWLVDRALLSKKNKIHNLDDFISVYDNLVINNEIIDSSNVYEYPEILTPRQQSNLIKSNKKLLLNYYEPGESYMRECKLLYDPNYNAFDFLLELL